MSIHYILTFPQAANHYVEVEATFATEGLNLLELFMAVWTPGSYLVREYSRHVEAIRASDVQGRELQIRKTRKNRWTVPVDGAAEVILRYRVYCRELSVRTNWVESGFAFLNGASTFISASGMTGMPHEVQFVGPAAWTGSVCGLDATSDGYIAPDYDTLVDSPILVGNIHQTTFDIEGRPHTLAHVGGPTDEWERGQIDSDVARIIRSQIRFWGGEAPYQRYVLMNLILDGGGGLEHRNSAVLLTRRGASATPQGYLDWLRLLSHEFFHVWNGKRLRPIELGPFDYENENYTQALWITEGFTEYYGDLMMVRERLMTPEQYLDNSLSPLIAKLHATPGRLVQSVAESSYDAWIRLYRPHENSVNTTVSYYTKGAVIAWLLDARIRTATGGRKSLDDLMRSAYRRFSGEKGFTEPDFIRLAEGIAGVPLDRFFRAAVFSAQELEYEEALRWFGLRWKNPERLPQAWFGAETKIEGGRLVITRLPRDTPAYESGLNVDDEILSVNGEQTNPEGWAEALRRFRPGEPVRFTIVRRGVELGFDAPLSLEPPRWQIESDPAATLDQHHHMADWLGAAIPSDESLQNERNTQPR